MKGELSSSIGGNEDAELGSRRCMLPTGVERMVKMKAILSTVRSGGQAAAVVPQDARRRRLCAIAMGVCDWD